MIRRGTAGSLVFFAVLITLVAMPAPANAASPDPADDPTRVSLSTLRPRISAAVSDRGRPYADGCHAAPAVTRPVHCTYGRRDGRIRVVVIGDSITAQWWAAIDGAARRGGWRVTWMTKSACPAADVTVRRLGTRYTACDTWRRNVLTKIRGLSRVDLVVMSGSSSSTLLRRRDGSVISGTTLRATAWRNGYQRTIDRLAGQVRRVVILRDTPAFTRSIPKCVAAQGGSTQPCSRDRSASLSMPTWHAELSIDAAYGWVRATDLADRLCQPTRCWPVTVERLLRYRDDHHLTNTYAAAMAPAMYSRLRWLIR
jgi:hypothetical protein